MNISTITMNKLIQTISSTVVIFALVFSGFNAPGVAVAHAQTLPGFSFDLPGFDLPDLNVDLPDLPNLLGGGSSAPDIVLQTCSVTASRTTIPTGGNTTLTWNTSGFNNFTLNGQNLNGANGTIEMTNILQNTTYELIAIAEDNSRCTASVTIICIPPTPADCRLEVIKTVDKTTAAVNDILTYTITVKNIGTTDCTGSGVKIEDVVSERITYLTNTVSSNLRAGYEGIPVYTAADRTLHFNGNILNPNESGTITWTGRINAPATCGNFEVPNQARATALELNNFNDYAYSQTVITQVTNACADPAPSCDSFTANPATIVVGSQAQLSWQTTNASQVSINNGVGTVAADGTVSVSPLTSTTYTLTAFGTQNRSVTCTVPVIVSSDPVPVCQSFTATPSSLPSTGGQVTLAWNVTGASAVLIAPTLGSVAAQGSQSVAVTASTNYILTATDVDGDQVTCAAPVTVANQVPLTCADNVSFTATDTSIDEGDSVGLAWSTTNIDSLTISGINATALSGSTTVDPRSDTTYVLTARRGTQSVDCPLTINVDEDGGGGGGGGSSTPRCELTISDNQIRRGEEVTLRWDTSRATAVTLKDDRNNILSTTDGVRSSEKDEFYDGSIKVRPTRDTEYTLTAERGSRDRICKVKVDVDDLRVLSDRDQQPLVAGISLSNTPYTGFEAGPVLTIFFYTLLAAWALFVTYLIVARPRSAVGIVEGPSVAVQSMQKAEAVRPDVFAPSIVAASTATFPANLPVGTPVIGYENAAKMTAEVNEHHVTDDAVAQIENRAHEQRALLSSDAIRHFVAHTAGVLERNDVLDEVISKAKSNFPLEDGWIVINEARMRELCETKSVVTTSFTPTIVPEGSSSLAEAIVTGNIVAAYEMIGNRPMFALADAAADFDNVIRARKGEDVAISNLLSNEAAKLSEEQIRNIIAALTGALDGTYTDEASAVKMAIMKAVKQIA
jgi:uncharacterized repeat protein (TIGR01451 family)